MLATGLQNSLFLILLVQCAGGQDLAGVLSALQGQAGEVLVKGDPVRVGLEKFSRNCFHTFGMATEPFDISFFQDYESRRLVMNAACSDEPAVIGKSNIIY